jgi:1-acyl-sn-glycerol-3-phosphate acyltransferase
VSRIGSHAAVKVMAVPLQPGSGGRRPQALGNVLRDPIPGQLFGDRWLLRALALLGRTQIGVVGGLEHVSAANDPFILALNHSTRREAVLVPAALILYRGGRLIHFMADWNFRLIPLVGLIYRRAQTITVTRKSARPPILDLLKPLYLERLSVVERARACLLAGKSVGIFPEGRVNRDQMRLMKGRTGAAYLSLQTGVPVVPVGIRLPDVAPGQVRAHAPLEIRIGSPLMPPRRADSDVRITELRLWHGVVMSEISHLSGKAWDSATGAQRCRMKLA